MDGLTFSWWPSWVGHHSIKLLDPWQINVPYRKWNGKKGQFRADHEVNNWGVGIGHLARRSPVGKAHWGGCSMEIGDIKANFNSSLCGSDKFNLVLTCSYKIFGQTVTTRESYCLIFAIKWKRYFHRSCSIFTHSVEQSTVWGRSGLIFTIDACGQWLIFKTPISCWAVVMSADVFGQCKWRLCKIELYQNVQCQQLLQVEVEVQYHAWHGPKLALMGPCCWRRNHNMPCNLFCIKEKVFDSVV